MRSGSFLEVEPGVEIYYEDTGDGPPLVFVPGGLFRLRCSIGRSPIFRGPIE